MKILFYHHNNVLTNHTLVHAPAVFMGLASIYLKTYVEIKKPEVSKKLEWCVPQQLKLSDEELIALIDKEKIDILCTTHYIWNYKALLDQLKRIKDKVSPEILFLAGGPSVDVNINPNYFVDNQFIDYAFYGSGEKAFAEFIEMIVDNKPLDPAKLSNMAWPDVDRQAIVAEYEYVPQLKTSPFVHNKQMFTEMIDDIKTYNCFPIIPYELTRGCPYACTFCDWNTGFSNKTTRRKESYKDEIDLFYDLGIQHLYLSDANVGQYQEDLDMIDYLAEKNITQNAGFKVDGNFSKLRKENNLKIYHAMAKSGMCNNFVISLQDSNPDVLDNIDRPDVGWEAHTKIITELTESYPNIPALVQLIQGLPGQTVESWRQTLSDVVKQDNVIPLIYVNEILSASPAARDQNYIEKWNFKYSHSLRWDTLAQSEFRSPFSMSCTSFSEYDFVEMTLLSLIYTTVINHKRSLTINNANFDLDKIVDSFLISDYYKNLKDNLTENWLNHDKFYFTTEIDGSLRDTPSTACCMVVSDIIPKINNNHVFLKWTINHLQIDSNYKRNEYAKHIFKQQTHQSLQTTL